MEGVLLVDWGIKELLVEKWVQFSPIFSAVSKIRWLLFVLNLDLTRGSPFLFFMNFNCFCCFVKSFRWVVYSGGTLGLKFKWSGSFAAFCLSSDMASGES